MTEANKRKERGSGDADGRGDKEMKRSKVRAFLKFGASRSAVLLK
jgi:hypothetical protein